MNDLEELKKRIIKFRDERDWKQFHSVQHLINALSIEVSELSELFLWKTESEINQSLKNDDFQENVNDEIADILNYLMLISDKLSVDIIKASNNKINKNQKKYPIDKFSGVSTKYNKINDND